MPSYHLTYSSKESSNTAIQSKFAKAIKSYWECRELGLYDN